MKTNNPLISIIIPTFNRKLLVKDAIDSVLIQKPQNYEVIVVDDGSTDGTAEFIKTLNLPVKVIRVKNGGASRARNIGIKKAKGKYILFLDSDDLLLPEILRLESEYLINNPDAMIVYSDYFIELQGKMLEKTRFNMDINTKRDKESFEYPMLVGKQAPIHLSSTMMRKTLLEEVGNFNENLKLHEDPDLYNRITAKYKLHYINKPLAIYRFGKDPEHLLSLEKTQLFISEAKKYFRYYEARNNHKKSSPIYQKMLNKSYRNLQALEELLQLYRNGEITKKAYFLKRWGAANLRARNHRIFYINIAGFIIKIQLNNTPHLDKQGQIQKLIATFLGDFIVASRSKIDFEIDIVDKILNKNGNEKFPIVFDGKRKITTNYGIKIPHLQSLIKGILFILTRNDGFLLRSSAIKINKKAYIIIGKSSNKRLNLVMSLRSKYRPLSYETSIVRCIKGKYYFFENPFWEKQYILSKTPNKNPLAGVIILNDSSTKIVESDKTAIISTLLDKILKPEPNSIKNVMEFIASYPKFYHLIYSNNEPELFKFLANFKNLS